LNEKVVAAKRAGVKIIIIPKLNEKDLKELPDFVREGLEFRLVETMDEVLEITLKPVEGRELIRSEEDGKRPYAH
jgi:ATP-dependent Lon protease